MGRPIYNYELTDPDFSWLVNSYKENNPKYSFVDTSGVPISFIKLEKSLEIKELTEESVEEFKQDNTAKIKEKEQETSGEKSKSSRA